MPRPDRSSANVATARDRSLPAREFEAQLHQRLVDMDPVAPADLAFAYLNPLLRRLRAGFRSVRDETLIHDAAIDAILDYAEHPARYDPEKSRLLTYLTMSAAGNLRNALQRERRRAWHELPLEIEQEEGRRERVPREDLVAGAEEEHVLEALAEQELWRRIAEFVPDPRDQACLRLMLEGERETGAYAKVLGVDDLAPADQRRAVKRQKDRLRKRLARLGERLRGEQVRA